MRSLVPIATLLSAFAFAVACASPASAQKGPQAEEGPGLVSAPAGVSDVVAEFFAICALALTDIGAARGVAEARGWSADEMGVSAQPLPARLGVFHTLSGENEDADIAFFQLMENRYPHATSRVCMLQLHDLRGENPVNIPLLDQTPGFEGGFGGLPASAGAGRWSRVLDGDLVTLDAISSDRFVTLTLVRLTRVRP